MNDMSYYTTRCMKKITSPFMLYCILKTYKAFYATKIHHHQKSYFCVWYENRYIIKHNLRTTLVSKANGGYSSYLFCGSRRVKPLA